MAENPNHKPKLKKHPKHQSQLLTATDVLQSLLENSKSHLADGFQRWRLEQQWSEVVGKTIGEQTLPAAFEQGTLFIWVRHSTWMQQLYFFQEDIKNKVNKHLGRAWVKKVQFTLNKRSAGAPPESNY